jgi:hypothetical protein
VSDRHFESQPVEPVITGLVFESEPIIVTHENEEFLVSYIARVLSEQVVLVFTIKNTLSFAVTDVSLRRVRPDSDFEPIEATVCDEIATGGEGTVTLTYSGSWSEPQMLRNFECSVVFRMEDEDGEYQLLNGAPLKIAAFMRKTPFTDFQAGFTALAHERKERMQFKEAKSHADAVKALTDALGMSVLGSRKRAGEGDGLELDWLVFGTELVLGRLVLSKVTRKGVLVESTFRSNSEAIVEAVLQSLFQ